jgi:hypothetical protein
VREDPRLLAFWLQGSLADGTADPLSDVDAYLAIDDAAFDSVLSSRRDIVERLGTILAFMDTPLPGLHAVHCLLDGPVKLDLFFEPLSKALSAERPAVRMRVDKASIGPRLKTGWEPPVETAVRRLDALYRGIQQGAAWPIRLLERGQWGTFAMVELELINDNLAQVLAAQRDPRLLFKNRLSYPRLLPADQRDLIESLSAAVLSALAERDLSALQEIHLQINAAIVREGRAAYAALGMPYAGSDEGDAAIAAFYRRAWPGVDAGGDGDVPAGPADAGDRPAV